ncbi:hypothetical protein MC885_011304 [Smutsia gigantea]|nr:hypothetical protein MC885_011304 [Smutsia gigantea]
MNSSVGDLGASGCSPWDDPARFIVVPTAYALALALGLLANVVALAVLGRSGRRLSHALRLYLLNLALADVLFTRTLLLWLTYYLGSAHWPFPDACRAAGAAYYVSTYATVAFFAAAFLLVLAAYVSLARALGVPSGPGGPHRRAARTMVLGLLLVFALCLAPYHLLLAPWVAGQEGATPPLHPTSCTRSARRC